MYQASKQIIDFLKSYETLELEAYLPTPNDRFTISYGCTFYEDGKPVKKGDKITKERADKLFEAILAKFSKDVNSLIKNNLKQNQFDALLSFAYNLGSDIDADTIAEGLGDSTLLKKVNKNPNDLTIEQEFKKWNKQAGKVLNGLTKRRTAEWDIYNKGIYVNHK